MPVLRLLSDPKVLLVLQGQHGAPINVKFSMGKVSSFIIIIINLLAQKHHRVTCATKQIERDSKDTDATNSCPRKVQVKTIL